MFGGASNFVVYLFIVHSALNMRSEELVNTGEIRTLDSSALRSVFASKNRLTIFVQLKFRDDAIRRLNANIHLGTICLVPRDSFNMDYELPTVTGRNFALAILVYTANDHDLIILTNGDRSDVVLRLQLL